MATPNGPLYPELAAFLESLREQGDQIQAERLDRIEALSDYMVQRQRASEPLRLNFICTHNSRRSIIGQVWAQAAAAHFGLRQVYTYSGGTQATAFNHRAVAALERVGFRIDKPKGENPHYQVHYADALPPLECYSKVFDADDNPKQHFAAVMTCAEADENCPFIPGAALRVALTYDDPKAKDDQPGEADLYNERVRQIGREVIHAFVRTQQKLHPNE